MFFNDDNNGVADTVLGTLFFGAMYYLSHLSGKQAAYKEMEEKTQAQEISELKRQLNELKKQKA